MCLEGRRHPLENRDFSPLSGCKQMKKTFASCETPCFYQGKENQSPFRAEKKKNER